MKTLITYYSFSGNTDKVCQAFAKALRSKGEVEIQRLRPKSEATTFFAQCTAAFTRKRPELEGGVKFDVSPYDLLIIGCPVWAFAPAPAMNTFLDNITGLTAKKAVIVLTSGSGAGVQKCFDNIETVLKNRGASAVARLNIKDTHVSEEAFLVGELEKAL